MTKYDKLRAFLNYLHLRDEQWHAFAGPNHKATELTVDWAIGQIISGTDEFNWDAIADQRD